MLPSLLLAAMVLTAAPPKLVGGMSLDQWQDRIREIVPGDPASAKWVPGLIEIVADRGAPDLLRKQAAFTLGRIGAPAAAAIPLLEEIIRKEDQGEAAAPRCWAAKGLSYFKSAGAATTPTLAAILRDRKAHPLHRQAMLDPLAAIGGAHPDVVPALVDILQADDDPPGVPLRELSLEAAMILGPQADPLVPLLIRILRQPREAASMRRKAAGALGTMGARAEPAAAALAESVVADADESVRDAAADALGRIGVAAIPVLRRLATSADAGVRWRVAAALGRMQGAARPASDLLQTLLGDAEPLVRMAACEAWWQVHQSGQSLVAPLVALLAGDNRDIRMRSLKQLMLLARDRAAIRRALAPLLEDDRAMIRELAGKLLEKLDAAETP